MMYQKRTKKDQETLRILEQVMDGQYRFIFHYPRLAWLMPTPETGDKMETLGLESVTHAATLAGVIVSLGGKTWFPTMETFPYPLNLKELLSRQLAWEKRAESLYREVANSLNEELANSLRQIAQQEKRHIRLVEEILVAL